MLLIPAIYLHAGRAMLLPRGDKTDAPAPLDTAPLLLAGQWYELGARRLHLIDLEGSDKGRPANTDSVRAIAEAHPDLQLQVGGGVRDEEAVDEYIQAGARYVVVTTRIVHEPHRVSDLCAEFSSRIIVALGARAGRVAAEGWSKLSRHTVIDLAQKFVADGVEAIIYTDLASVDADGVNIQAVSELAEAVDVPVLALGGIQNLANVRRLAESDSGLAGLIVRRALYTGELDFAEAAAALEKSGRSSFGW